MSLERLRPFLAITLLLCHAKAIHSQEAVVNVSQILPFAASGTVTSGVTSVKIGETPISTSPGSAPIPASTLGVAMAGGKISTGADGAASLVLGKSAEAGTARLGVDSEVKVPEIGEKDHSLEILKGQLFLNISSESLKQRGNGEFRLKTPAALLAVKGTKFFSTTKDGKDTIGVHEGAVEVLEPMTGQKIMLIAGQAADVSPGILSAMREMTVEERDWGETYRLTELVKTTLAILVSTAHDQQPRQAWTGGVLRPSMNDWMNWRRMNSSILFFEKSKHPQWRTGPPPACELLQDGIVRIRLITVPEDKNALTNTIQAVWEARRSDIEGVRDKIGVTRRPMIPKIQTLQFRVRTRNVAQIRFHGETLAFVPADNAWHHCRIPLQDVSPTINGTSAADPCFMLLFKVVAQPRTAGAAVEPCVIDMQDFHVLSLPLP